MRFIITGGSGLIGTELVNDMASDGHEMVVLSRNPARVTGMPASVQVVGWDGKTAEGWGHLADGAAAIINLAGESIAGQNPLAGRWTAERKHAILHSRLQATGAVMQAIQQAQAKPALIQSSAVGYYGPRADEDLTETASAGSDFLADVCKQWEAAAQPAAQAGARLVIFRTGVVISMQGGALPFMVLPYRLFNGGPLGSGKQWFPWIHLEDEVAAIRYFAENTSTHGVYNLCAPNPLTNNDFGKTIGKVLGRPHWLPAPGFAIKLALGELSTLLLDGQRQIPSRLMKSSFRYKFSEAESALRDLLK